MADIDTWMPLYIGDYMADTARLKTIEHGAYLLLIMDYWRNGPPPDCDETLATISKLSQKVWVNHSARVRGLFTIVDGFLRHKRIDEELIKAKQRAEKSSEKASVAANARWKGRKINDATSNALSNATSTPQAMLEQCPSPSPSPTPIKTKSKSTTKAAPTARVELPEWINEIDWTDFIAHRKAISRPMTKNAQERAIRELAKLKDDGHLPSAVISQSIVRGWSGLFKIAEQRDNGTNGHARHANGNDGPAWWASNNGIDAKGRELGMTPHGNESYPDYKQRIFDRMKGTAQ